MAKKISKDILQKAFSKLCTAKAMTQLYEDNFKIVSKYVHATSRGHETIQIALGLQLLPHPSTGAHYKANRDHYLVPAFKSLLTDFYSGVKKGSSPHPNFKDGVKVQRCIEAIIDSDDKKRWINVD